MEENTFLLNKRCMWLCNFYLFIINTFGYLVYFVCFIQNRQFNIQIDYKKIEFKTLIYFIIYFLII